MSSQDNLAVIRRYFTEVIDGGKVEVVAELFTPDCLVHRPEFPNPIVGVAGVSGLINGLQRLFTDVHTTLLDLFAVDDRVAARLRHDVVVVGAMPTRSGIVQAAGKPIHWTANAIFCMVDGQIAEEWVERDEAGILQQLGVIQTPRPS